MATTTTKQPTIYYEKRKNVKLLAKLGQPNVMGLKNAQNYCPLYRRIFALNETNYTAVVLNNEWFVSDVVSRTNDNNFTCKLQNTSEYIKPRNCEVFAKIIPLISPFEYAKGRLPMDDKEVLFALPGLGEGGMCPSIGDPNNAAYTDAFFIYLSGVLKRFGFIHGLDYYGSFIGHKTDFVYNVAEELEALNSYPTFHRGLGKHFFIAQRDLDMFKEFGGGASKPVNKIALSYNSKTSNAPQALDLDIFDTLIDDDTFDVIVAPVEAPQQLTETTLLSCVENTPMVLNEVESVASAATSTKSSSCGTSRTPSSLGESEYSDEEEDDDYSDDDDDEELIIPMMIPTFPVNVVFMEKNEGTVEQAMYDGDFDTEDKWMAMLMQVVMNLLTYQKAFKFTHNDLHANNVMYISTSTKWIYYCYSGVTYKVPTYGRLYKVIDFGRAIYEVGGERYCSDHFKEHNEGHTQYNTEPYFDETKDRVEPNYSFDLTRFATSIFDFVFMNDDSTNSDASLVCNEDSLGLCKDAVQRIITSWCLDDSGKNILYKANGDERYPDFKLYKMIARIVHRHTPEVQLARPEFQRYVFSGGNVLTDKKLGKRVVSNNGAIIDIDGIIQSVCG